jgi:hypothetical protein
MHRLQDEQRERAGSVTASEQARLDIAGGALEQERRNPVCPLLSSRRIAYLHLSRCPAFG